MNHQISAAGGMRPLSPLRYGVAISKALHLTDPVLAEIALPILGSLHEKLQVKQVIDYRLPLYGEEVIQRIHGTLWELLKSGAFVANGLGEDGVIRTSHIDADTWKTANLANLQFLWDRATLPKGNVHGLRVIPAMPIALAHVVAAVGGSQAARTAHQEGFFYIRSEDFHGDLPPEIWPLMLEAKSYEDVKWKGSLLTGLKVSWRDPFAQLDSRAHKLPGDIIQEKINHFCKDLFLQKVLTQDNSKGVSVNVIANEDNIYMAKYKEILCESKTDYERRLFKNKNQDELKREFSEDLSKAGDRLGYMRKSKTSKMWVRKP